MQPPGGSTSENTQAPPAFSSVTAFGPWRWRKPSPKANCSSPKRVGPGHRRQRVFPGDASERHHGLHSAGAFKLDRDGRIVTPDGFLLTRRSRANRFGHVFRRLGRTSAACAGDATPRQLGTIQLARFTNAAGLQSMGKNLFYPRTPREQPSSEPPARKISVRSPGFWRCQRQHRGRDGSYDYGQRAYEINSKVVQTRRYAADRNNLKR